MRESDILKKSMLLLFLVSFLFIVGCSEPIFSQASTGCVGNESFCDDFNDGDSIGWDIYSGNWTVIDGAYRITEFDNTNNYAMTSQAINFIIPKDYDLSLDFQLIENIQNQTTSEDYFEACASSNLPIFPPNDTTNLINGLICFSIYPNHDGQSKIVSRTYWTTVYETLIIDEYEAVITNISDEYGIWHNLKIIGGEDGINYNIYLDDDFILRNPGIPGYNINGRKVSFASHNFIAEVDNIKAQTHPQEMKCCEEILESITMTQNFECLCGADFVGAWINNYYTNITLDCNGYSIISGWKDPLFVEIPGRGIFVDTAGSPNEVHIKNCNILGFEYGIDGSFDSLENSYLKDGWKGVVSTGNALVFNNTFYNFSQYGLSAGTGPIWNNNFINNTVNAVGGNNNTRWDYNEIGNYWDDFESNPGYPFFYEISQNSRDNYPIWNLPCVDKTPSLQCSSSKPLYCQYGKLVFDCRKCGCERGFTCEGDGQCARDGILGIRIR